MIFDQRKNEMYLVELCIYVFRNYIVPKCQDILFLSFCEENFCANRCQSAAPAAKPTKTHLRLGLANVSLCGELT